MKRLACLAILTGLVVPCAASDPRPVPRLEGRHRERQTGIADEIVVQVPKLLDDDYVLAIVFPSHAASQWAVNQLGFGQTVYSTENRQFTGNVIGAQVRGGTVRGGTGNVIHKD